MEKKKKSTLSKSNVIYWEFNPVQSQETTREIEIVSCPSCSDTNFFMLKDDHQQIVCVKCGNLSGHKWD